VVRAKRRGEPLHGDDTALLTHHSVRRRMGRPNDHGGGCPSRWDVLPRQRLRDRQTGYRPGRQQVPGDDQAGL